MYYIHGLLSNNKPFLQLMRLHKFKGSSPSET